MNYLLTIIKELPLNRASVLNDIPLKTIKNSAQVYSSELTQILYHCVFTASFPDLLKYADVTPAFKKVMSQTRKIIDLQVHHQTLRNDVLIFEKLIYNQIFEFRYPKLSKYIAGFWKNYNTEYALLKMNET